MPGYVVVYPLADVGAARPDHTNVDPQFVGDSPDAHPERIACLRIYRSPPPQRTCSVAIHPGQGDSAIFGGEARCQPEEVAQTGGSDRVRQRYQDVIPARTGQCTTSQIDETSRSAEAQRVRRLGQEAATLQSEAVFWRDRYRTGARRERVPVTSSRCPATIPARPAR